MAPAQESFDSSLFPDAQAAQEAAAGWGQAQEEAAKGKPIGTFQATIVRAELCRATSSNRLQISYELELLGPGETKGVKIPKHDGLGSPKQTEITQGQLTRLGIDVGKVTLGTLPSQLLAIQGKVVQISTKSKDGFYNVFFQKLITNTGTAASSVAPAEGKAAGRTAANTGKRRF